MMTMTSPRTPSPEDLPSAGTHAPMFSEPEVVEAVVIPDLDPATAAPVFSSTY
jgi:hypothetical protein